MEHEFILSVTCPSTSVGGANLNLIALAAAALMKVLSELSRELVRDTLDLAKYLEAGPSDATFELFAFAQEETVARIELIIQLLNCIIY